MDPNVEYRDYIGKMENTMETTGLRIFRGHGHLYQGLTKKSSSSDTTWTPKVCKTMAFMASIMGLGLLFYILLGFR